MGIKLIFQSVDWLKNYRMLSRELEQEVTFNQGVAGSNPAGLTNSGRDQ